MKKVLKPIQKVSSWHLLLVSVGVIVYLAAKVYVLTTPTPIDDQIPDKIRNTILMIADEGNDKNA